MWGDNISPDPDPDKGNGQSATNINETDPRLDKAVAAKDAAVTIPSKREGCPVEEDLLPMSRRLKLQYYPPYPYSHNDTRQTIDNSSNGTSSTFNPSQGLGSSKQRTGDIKMEHSYGDMGYTSPVAGGEREEETPRLPREAKGKGKMKVVPELPAEVWTRIFELYYDQCAEDWQTSGGMNNGVTPLLISPTLTNVATPVLYAHPHLSSKTIEPFIKSLAFPFRCSDSRYKKPLVHHMTVRPTPIIPNYENTNVRGSSATVSHQFTSLMSLFPNLDSFTLKDTFVFSDADAQLIISGLKQIRPKKARIELRFWDLYDSPVGKKLIASTRPNTRAAIDQNFGPDRPNPRRPRIFGDPEDVWPNGRGGNILQSWQSALETGHDLHLPPTWLDPDAGPRAPPNAGQLPPQAQPPVPAPVFGPTLGPAPIRPSLPSGRWQTTSLQPMGAAVPPQAQVHRTGHTSGYVRVINGDINGDGDADNDQEAIVDGDDGDGSGIQGSQNGSQPGPALPTGGSHIDPLVSHPSSRPFIGGTSSDAPHVSAGETSANDNIETLHNALLVLDTVGNGTRPSTDDSSRNVASGSQTSHGATHAGDGTDRTVIDSSSSSVPQTHIGDDTDTQQRNAGTSELSTRPGPSQAEPTPLPVAAPTAPRVRPTPSALARAAQALQHVDPEKYDFYVRDRRIDHIYVPEDDKGNAEDDGSPVAGPSAFSNDVLYALAAQMSNNSDHNVPTPTGAPTVNVDVPNVRHGPAPRGDIYDYDVPHRMRLELKAVLTKIWAGRLQAFSFVAFDPMASLVVRAPQLDFWVDVPVEHIRVHLPRGVNSLAIFKGPKENERDRLESRGIPSTPAARAAALAALAAARATSVTATTPTAPGVSGNVGDAAGPAPEEPSQDPVVGGDGSGGGLVHPSNLLFEIEVNTMREMMNGMWNQAGSELPPQVCRILQGDQDWSYVVPGRLHPTTPVLHGPEDDYPSPKTDDYPSPTYSFESSGGSDEEMEDLDLDVDSQEPGEGYDAEAASRQMERLAARRAEREGGVH